MWPSVRRSKLLPRCRKRYGLSLTAQPLAGASAPSFVPVPAPQAPFFARPALDAMQDFSQALESNEEKIKRFRHVVSIVVNSKLANNHHALEVILQNSNKITGHLVKGAGDDAVHAIRPLISFLYNIPTGLAVKEVKRRVVMKLTLELLAHMNLAFLPVDLIIQIYAIAKHVEPLFFGSGHLAKIDLLAAVQKRALGRIFGLFDKFAAGLLQDRKKGPGLEDPPPLRGATRGATRAINDLSMWNKVLHEPQPLDMATWYPGLGLDWSSNSSDVKSMRTLLEQVDEEVDIEVGMSGHDGEHEYHIKALEDKISALLQSDHVPDKLTFRKSLMLLLSAAKVESL